MGRLFTLLVVVAAVAWLLRRFAVGSGAGGGSSGPEGFMVAMKDGRVVDVEGHLPRNFLHALSDIAAMHSVSGEIRLAGDDELRFTSGIPEGVRQQVRNAYFSAATVH